MIFAITLEAKSGEGRPILNRVNGVLHERHAEPRQQRFLLAESAELHFVTKAILHERHKVADAIDQPFVHTLLTKEHFAREQVGIIG